jgi:hypothetical protein
VSGVDLLRKVGLRHRRVGRVGDVGQVVDDSLGESRSFVINRAEFEQVVRRKIEIKIG